MSQKLAQTAAKSLVSVIIPTYNCSGFLKESISSALAQTYRDLEVVVVDDGSTDDTAHVVSMFDDRVRYIYQTNAGTATARNTGISNARGSLIAFLDHDDLWLPNKLERQVPYLLADDTIGMLFCGRQFFNTYTGQVTSTHPAEPELDVHELLGHTTIALQSAIVPMSVLEDVGLFDTELLGTDDWEMTIRIARKYRVVGVPEVMVSIRGHEGQQGIMTERMYQNSLRVLAKHKRMHDNCAACRSAVVKAFNAINEDYYQRQRVAATKALREHRLIAALQCLTRAFSRRPQAFARVPARFIEAIGRKLKRN